MSSQQKSSPQKTFLPKEADLQPQWFVFDASGKTLGRFASEVAKILLGKHRPTYTPHLKTGDAVIVVNAEKITVTGRKEAQKEYVHHTGYPGGQRRIPYRVMKERHPERILRHAVWGMMPHNRRGRALFKRLRIFVGPEHNLSAQQPVTVNI